MSDTQPPRRPRRRVRGSQNSRTAMRARRSAPPLHNPCPPGPVGGQYRPLSDTQCRQITDTALRILAELGISEVPDIVAEQALKQGATLNATGRLCFSQQMVEAIIDGACKEFTLYGRDPRHDIKVGGDKVYFGTGGAAVQTLDLDDHRYRPATLHDLYNFSRLADALQNVSWFTRCCVATDVPDILDLDINTAYALLRGTNKPIGTSFTLGSHVDAVVELFDTALGGAKRFRARPFCKAHISPVISPLRYGADAVEVALACIRHGMPINCIIAAQAGATAPATIAGMLAQTLAETLAGLIMVNLFAPGHPVIFSNWPFVIDLRSGAFAGSGGEISLLNAASAQLSNQLGLPSGVACSMADAKAVDAQMGMEKTLSSLAVGLAGANLVYESSGMTASLLGASFEAFVIDDEMLSHVYRVLRGIEVDDQTLAFDAVRAAIEGEGHFLGGAHTLAAMERDYFYPGLADRLEPRTWQELGAKDMWWRAGERARQILNEHRPAYIEPAQDKQIRERFTILLNE